jgi:hypothetical protein
LKLRFRGMTPRALSVARRDPWIAWSRKVKVRHIAELAPGAWCFAWPI